MCELSPVSFHGDTIFCIDYHGEPFTPMKPIVENMGMDWAGQFSKLRSNQARWGIENISIPTESGVQEMVSMPVRKLPAFLASINPRKVRAELRAKIELYQNESDNALWDYWTKGRAERQPVSSCSALPPADAPITPDQQCTLQAIVKAKIEALPEAERRQRGLYPKVWSRFNNHFRLAQYRQLPQCRLSEAITYLMQMELTPAKPLPPSNCSEIPNNCPETIPADALDAMTDSQRAKRFRGLLREVQGLAKKVGSTMNMVRLTTNPGARMLGLPPALNARYNALDQMHKLAVAGLYQAEHTLYCLYYMGEGVKFV